MLSAATGPSSGASAPSQPPRRGALGRLLVHSVDTPGHNDACVCLSCNGWKPPGVEVLPSDPSKSEETYAFVVQRRVPGKDQRPTTNVKWFCMGCGNEYTSGATRMREHRLGGGNGVRVRYRCYLMKSGSQ